MGIVIDYKRILIEYLEGNRILSDRHLAKLIMWETTEQEKNDELEAVKEG